MSKVQEIWSRIITKPKTETVIDKPNDEVSIEQKSVCNENRSKEELIMQPRIEEHAKGMEEAVIEEQIEELDKETLIGKLIEQGFVKKYSENFDEAVYLFSKALSLDPKPDLALYLIIDCYWLWNNLGERDYALTQLEEYIKRYLPLLNPDLRHQFDAWMTKENLFKIV